MGELYWMALSRDIPFADYETDPRIQEAVEDLNNFSRSNIFNREGKRGMVTPQTIFRSTLPGADVGPFIS